MSLYKEVLFLFQFQGRILNLTSQSASWIVPAFSPYAASKAALEALSEGLRLELQKFDIDVVLLNPGSNNPCATPLCQRQEVCRRRRRPIFVVTLQQDKWPAARFV